MPSQIFEFINLGLPILGAVPPGEAMDIINENRYGIACNYNDTVGLKEAIKRLHYKQALNGFKNNILRDRPQWSMEKKFKELLPHLTRLST